MLRSRVREIRRKGLGPPVLVFFGSAIKALRLHRSRLGGRLCLGSLGSLSLFQLLLQLLVLLLQRAQTFLFLRRQGQGVGLDQILVAIKRG